MIKKLNNMHLFILAILVVMTTGCKKDKSESTTVLSNAQMIQGNWEVLSETSAGTDLLHLSYSDEIQCNSGTFVSYTETYTFVPYHWHFQADSVWSSEQEYHETYLDEVNTSLNCAATYINDNGTIQSNGSWSLNSNETQVTITKNGIEEVWDILTLNMQEMRLQLVGPSTHLMRLKKL